MYFNMLERLSIPNFLQKKLEERYQAPEERIRESYQEKIAEYERRISYFSETVLNGRLSPHELATPHTFDSNLSAITEEAAVYFQQGREMLQTSHNMPENSSPLVEYYGFLQCVKGMVLLEINVNKKQLFSRHGLTQSKTPSRYINVKIMPLGVFTALLLRRGGVIFKKYKEAIDFFFSQPYCPSLEEIVTDRFTYGDPRYAFIMSWMLSSLVRYSPLKWKEIQDGTTDDIILSIREYRRHELTKAFEHLFSEYVPDPSPW